MSAESGEHSEGEHSRGGTGEKHSRRIDFFQLVSWLQRSRADRALIGHLGSKGLEIGEEWLRLRPHLSLNFPVRDVQAIEHEPANSGRSDRLRLDVNFGGLYGTDGVLPPSFTEYFQLDDRNGHDLGHDKEAVRAFLDIFHHRLYSLLFRAWEKRRYYTTFKRDGSDDISQMLFALTGLDNDAVQQIAGVEGAFSKLRLLRHGALMLQRPRSVAVLQAALQDYCGSIPVRVEQFVESRHALAPEDCTYLTVKKRLVIDGGARAAPRRLGRDSILGTSLRDRSTKIRVEVGPLDFAEFEDFLPGTSTRKGLDGLVRRLVPVHLEHEVRLYLAEREAPPLRLRARADVRLGWTSWVRAEPSKELSVLFAADA